MTSGERRVRLAGRLGLLAVAAVQGWGRRFFVSPDGLSYLDLAAAWSRGELEVAVNGYWSPAYPWLLAAVLEAVEPAPAWESTVVHLVDLATFALALAAFELFWSRFRRRSPDPTPPPAAWWALGYGVYAAAALGLTTVWQTTPDLLGLLWLLLAAAVGLKLAEEGGAGRWLAVGALLGLGYLAKVALLPAGLILLAALAVDAHRRRSGAATARGVLLALLAVAGVAAPWAVALSTHLGRPTLGEAGRLNYGWYVAGAEGCGQHWQGRDPGLGTAAHPTRRLLEEPAVHGFATPVAGTYPPWLDPVHWHRGLDPPIDAGRQLRTVAVNLGVLVRGALLPYAAFFAGVGGLLALGGAGAGRRLRRLWPWLAAGAGPVVMYLLVHLETRFLGPSALFVGAAVVVAVRWPPGRRRLRGVLLAVALLGLAVPVLHDTATVASKSRRALLDPGLAAHHPWRVAAELRRLGLEEGDAVAFVGYSMDGYWARLAGVRIVADVFARPDLPGGDRHTRAFWQLDPEARARVTALLRDAGARAVVTRDGDAEGRVEEGWIEVTGTGYHLLFLEPGGEP